MGCVAACGVGVGACGGIRGVWGGDMQTFCDVSSLFRSMEITCKGSTDSSGLFVYIRSLATKKWFIKRHNSLEQSS